MSKYLTRYSIYLFMVICQINCQHSSRQTDTTYQSTWESLKNYETPQWFLDAKFGIYCHWGPYSVPAHKTEWYSHWMYIKDHPIREYHEETYGSLCEFGYKDFIPMFTAEKFDADEWADLFQKAGAQFAGPVTEHADGFAMWDSKVTKWNASQMGPKRDVVGELSKAIRKRDMKFITTFHHQWKFAWYPTWDETTDAADPAYAGLYGPKVPKGAFEMAVDEPKFLPEKPFNDDWLARLKEVVDKYEPDLLYFDNKMNIIPESYRKEFLSYYYNRAIQNKQKVVCTYKFHDLSEGSAVLDLERSRMSKTPPFPWLTDDSIDWGSWCHVSEPHYKSTNRLIDFLVDVVSKNGCVLLNITPRSNGEIPEPVKERLLEIGEWLKINGEAIYGTRPWKIYGEGPTNVVEGHLSERKNPDNTAKDIRFTQKGNVIYAFILDWPNGDVNIRSLGKEAALLNQKIQKIELLGINELLKWNQTDEALVVEVPNNKPCEHAFSLKLTLDY